MAEMVEQKRPSVSGADGVEAEVIGLFVQLSKMLGQPRSYAEIYGTLFMSPRPLSMVQLIERLGISRGSASQGLSFLKKAGAVRAVLIPGRRATHFEAVAELRHLARGFLRDQIMPQVEDGFERVNQIVQMTEGVSEAQQAHARARILMLQSWGKRTREFVPMMLAMLEA